MIKTDMDDLNPPKQVRCSNGKIYYSVREAARVLGLDNSSISKHIYGRRKHVKGYTFEYVDAEDHNVKCKNYQLGKAANAKREKKIRVKKCKELFKDGYSKQEIADMFNLKLSTIDGYLAKKRKNKERGVK